MIFEKLESVKDYLLSTYPKAKGNSVASWIVSDYAMAIGVYEGEDMIQGLMVYKDPNRNKWVLLDSLNADLAVRNYIEYREEFDEAIALFEFLEEIDEEENGEDLFFQDLD